MKTPGTYHHTPAVCGTNFFQVHACLKGALSTTSTLRVSYPVETNGVEALPTYRRVSDSRQRRWLWLSHRDLLRIDDLMAAFTWSALELVAGQALIY